MFSQLKPISNLQRALVLTHIYNGRQRHHRMLKPCEFIVRKFVYNHVQVTVAKTTVIVASVVPMGLQFAVYLRGDNTLPD